MVAITYLCVTSGVDWFYFSITRGVNFLFWIPAGLIGFLLPVLLPIILLVTGKIRKNEKRVNTAFVVAQSVILGSVISSAYKAFTGRIPPTTFDALIDTSHGFQFGFLEGGIF